nr:DUF1707 domain-containing protein [Saccharomonospora saliphila]
MDGEYSDDRDRPDRLDQRDLRVSDAEREHVVELLQQAIGRGMLTLDEFTERTDTALGSRTRGELNAVLIDLPGLTHTGAAPGPAGMPPGTSRPEGSADRVELRGHGSSLVRKGRWSVPSELLVRNKYGETRLDFTEAEFTSRVVHIRLDTKWCAVKFLVPQGAEVDINGLDELKWAHIDDKTRGAASGDSPRLVLTGRLHGGSLTLRHPRRGLFSC